MSGHFVNCPGFALGDNSLILGSTGPNLPILSRFPRVGIAFVCYFTAILQPKPLALILKCR